MSAARSILPTYVSGVELVEVGGGEEEGGEGGGHLVPRDVQPRQLLPRQA